MYRHSTFAPCLGVKNKLTPIHFNFMPHSGTEDFMVVAGDHAMNDMAGEEEDSWKSRLEAEGYEVTCVLKGLGEYKGIQKLYAEHAQNAKPL